MAAVYCLWFWITKHATVISAVVSTVAAVAVMIFTRRLAKTSYEQGELTRESIDLARQEFISTHRPRLRVRRLHSHINEGRPPSISYVVANVGESEATIKRIETTLCFRTLDGNEYAPPSTTPVELRTIEAGESWLYVDAFDIQFDGFFEIANGCTIEFRGLIEYADKAGIDRQTAFWRLREPSTGFFRPKGDPDYEYED